MKWTRMMAAVLAMACGATAATAQTPAPTPTPAPARAPEEQILTPPASQAEGSGGGLGLEQPKEPAPTPAVARDVLIPGRAPDHSRPSANAGTLKNLEALSLRDGEARVRLDGIDYTLRPGDTIAGDVVRRVEATRIVLARPEGDKREAIVIVTFDGQGRARVRVFGTLDPSPVAKPDIR